MSVDWSGPFTDKHRIAELEARNSQLEVALDRDENYRQLRRERELNQILIICCIFLLAAALAGPAMIWAHSRDHMKGGTAYDVEIKLPEQTANSL